MRNFTSSSRWSPLLTVLLLLLLLLLTLALYTLAHEGGHALMALLFGGKITGFSANFLNLSAHVGITGSFTTLQNALISAAGVTLPVLLCMAFILLAPPKNEPVLAWFKLLVFMAAVNALLAWIVIPVLVMNGKYPSDDSVNFLRYTELPPLAVTGAALLVYLLCWFLLIRRMGGFRALLAQYRAAIPNFDLPATRKSVGALAATGAAAALLILVLTQALPDRAFDAPPGYQPVADIHLSEKALNDVAIYKFTLDQPTVMSFYFDLYQIKGGPNYIHLVGPAGYDNVFFQILDPQSELSQASVRPQHIRLEKGDYEIRIAFPKSDGRIRVYVKWE